MASENELLERLKEKFEAIAELLASERGYGPVNTLAPIKRAELAAEVQDAIDEWSEAEVEDNPPQAKTRFQQLLAEYREIEEQILDARDPRLA